MFCIVLCFFHILFGCDALGHFRTLDNVMWFCVFLSFMMVSYVMLCLLNWVFFFYMTVCCILLHCLNRLNLNEWKWTCLRGFANTYFFIFLRCKMHNEQVVPWCDRPCGSAVSRSIMIYPYLTLFNYPYQVLIHPSIGKCCTGVTIWQAVRASRDAELAMLQQEKVAPGARLLLWFAVCSEKTADALSGLLCCCLLPF